LFLSREGKSPRESEADGLSATLRPPPRLRGPTLLIDNLRLDVG
jgi:hypothetical protein